MALATTNRQNQGEKRSSSEAFARAKIDTSPGARWLVERLGNRGSLVSGRVKRGLKEAEAKRGGWYQL